MKPKTRSTALVRRYCDRLTSIVDHFTALPASPERSSDLEQQLSELAILGGVLGDAMYQELGVPAPVDSTYPSDSEEIEGITADETDAEWDLTLSFTLSPMTDGLLQTADHLGKEAVDELSRIGVFTHSWTVRVEPAVLDGNLG